MVKCHKGLSVVQFCSKLGCACSIDLIDFFMIFWIWFDMPKLTILSRSIWGCWQSIFTFDSEVLFTWLMLASWWPNHGGFSIICQALLGLFIHNYFLIGLSSFTYFIRSTFICLSGVTFNFSLFSEAEAHFFSLIFYYYKSKYLYKYINYNL